MPKESLEVNIVYKQRVTSLKSVEDNGVTWLIPACETTVGHRSLPTSEYISVISEEIVEDFTFLGRLLEEGIRLEDYTPKYLQTAIQNELFQNNISLPLLYISEVMNDDLCPFINPRNKAQVISSFLTFFEKYGLPELVSDVTYQSIIEYIHTDQITIDQRFEGVPITYIIYLVYETYYLYSYPENYLESLKKLNPHLPKREAEKQAIISSNKYYNEDGSFRVDISVKYSFTFKSDKYDVETCLESIFDLIKFCMFYVNPDYQSICLYCRKPFKRTRPDKKYCDEKCRSNANSKKYYFETRKQKNIHKEGAKYGDD